MFSAQSAVVPGLNTSHQSMELNKTTIKTKIISNRLYTAKDLYSANTLAQLWLGRYKASKERSNDDDRIVDCTQLTNDILNVRFTM